MSGLLLVRVRCSVCGGEDSGVVCTAAEMQSQLQYLEHFHVRRQRHVTPEALADRAEFTQNYVTDLVQCRSCGLLFRNPRPSDRAITRAYQQDHYGRERLDTLHASQLELFRPIAQRLRRHLPPGSRVMEVGSFVGGFLRAGEEQGWRLLGVDPGEEVGEFCRSLGLPVYAGELPDFLRQPDPAWAPGTVDAVVIWNTFDQLPNPEPTLTAARRLLRPGGLLALRVPNGESFLLGLHGLRTMAPPLTGMVWTLLAWNNLLAFPYLHGYSVRTLDWLLSWHQFVRTRVVPDTLCRLSDAETRLWARWEERVSKWGLRALGNLQARLQPGNPSLAPWLDIYYRAGTARG